MKLTKSQADFIEKVQNIESKLEEKLWLRMDRDTGKWIMATQEDNWTGFYVHGKTVKALTDNKILVNEQFFNKYSNSMLTGMTLNNVYNEAV